MPEGRHFLWEGGFGLAFLLCAGPDPGRDRSPTVSAADTPQKEQKAMELQLVTRKLSDIHPYERNPRRNDPAVDAVVESIRQCSYIAPIVVDEDGMILAGHTRYKALKKLKRKEAEVIIKAGLSEEQKQKYRLLDNKTTELAGWDLDLLADELEGLDFGDLSLDWGVGGDEEPQEVGEPAGNFSQSEFNYTQQYGVTVILGSEAEQEDCYNKLKGMGYDCRVVTV